MRRILQEEKNRERKRRVVSDLPLNLHAEFKNAQSDFLGCAANVVVGLIRQVVSLSLI